MSSEQQTETLEGKVVVPGEAIVSKKSGYMEGTGTFETNNEIIATVVGKVTAISKLVTVIPIKSPYKPEVGDVIIGRIISVDKKFWRVNINAQRECLLNLTAINLPQGEQRIRGEEDQMQMRSFYAENDLLSGEIQQVNSNGVIHIQTRNLKYGKLKNGMLVKVSHGLVKKKKHQFISLDNDIKAILGINGLIWVYYSTVNVDEDYFTDDKTKIENIEKEEKPLKEHCVLIVLFKNIIETLDYGGVEINQDNILYIYNKIKGNGKEINGKVENKDGLLEELKREMKGKGSGNKQLQRVKDIVMSVNNEDVEMEG